MVDHSFFSSPGREIHRLPFSVLIRTWRLGLMGGVFWGGLVSEISLWLGLSLGFASGWLGVATISVFSVAVSVAVAIGSTIRSGSEDSIVGAGVGIGSSEGMICWGIGNRRRAKRGSPVGQKRSSLRTLAFHWVLDKRK